MNVHVASETFEGDRYRIFCIVKKKKKKLTEGSFAYGEKLTSSPVQQELGELMRKLKTKKKEYLGYPRKGIVQRVDILS